jgi:hypothetical protein
MADAEMILSFFLPHVGDRFDVYVGAPEPMPITLIEASLLAHASAPDIRAEPFQLKFAGPGPNYLNQMIHRLTHDALGELDIFLTPIGTREGGFLYQAVFN